MKKSLEDLPRDIAVDAWNDLLAWLKDYQKDSSVSRTDSIPFVEARFGALLEVAARRAIERQEIADLSGDAHKISLSLAAKLKHLDGLHQLSVRLLEFFRHLGIREDDPPQLFDSPGVVGSCRGGWALGHARHSIHFTTETRRHGENKDLANRRDLSASISYK